jgi:hypothetical protein
MGILSYGYKASKTPVGKKVVDTVKNIFTGGKQKTTGTEVIKSVKPNVPKNKSEKLKSQLKIAKQKTKASQAKLDNTIFRIEQQKKRLQREKKMGGGFMGKRMGYSQGSSKGKVPTTSKEKAFGMLSVKAKKDNNPNITFTDKIVGAKKT